MGRGGRIRFCQLCRSPQGFTLMEIMLATLILAMVVSMVTLSLSGSMKVVEATRDQGDIYYRAQVALERIGEDLESAILNDDSEFLGFATEDATDQELILTQFVSMAHVNFDPEGEQGGMGQIRYTLVPDPDDEEQLVLLRSDILLSPQGENTDNADEEDPDGFLLSDRLRSVSFTYFDAAGEEQDTWDTQVDDQMTQDEKDLKRRLPAAVSCRLEYWLDREEETTVSFRTSIRIPVGMVVNGV